MKVNRQENWIDILQTEFDHPATVLWRSVEAKYLDRVIQKENLAEPILDLGCAEGKLASILFRDRGIFGLDNCWDLIKQNNKADTYKTLILGDGCYMPFKDNSFGTVFSNSVIEHIPDLNNLLNEVWRILKADGLFIFTVPSHKFGEFLFFNVFFKNLGLERLAGWYSKKRNCMLNHFHCYSHKKWKEELKIKNFILLDYYYYMSKRAVMFWDYLAILIFIIDRVGVLNFIKKGLIHKFQPILNRYYNYDTESSLGGGLLIIAAKI